MSRRLDRRAALRLGLGAAAAATTAGLAGCASPPQAPAATSPSGSPPPQHPAAQRPAAPAPGTPHDPAGRPAVATGSAVEIANGSRARPLVALTFHGAGDPALARQVLSTVEAAGARITVLAVGTWLAAHPELARRIVGAGHELGNHTWTHPALAQLGAGAAAAEIDRCRDVIDRLTGSPGAHFRQSQGQHATPLIRQLAGRAGYRVCLSYDVDSRDWTDPGPAAIRAAVASGVRAGSVVSMHLGHPGTLAALPSILADLDRRGLRAVTASALLQG